MIYFIASADAGQIKIGYSAEPRKRLSKMQSDSAGELKLLGVLPGTIEHERALHATFAHLRLRGEWFRDDGSIRAQMEVLGAALPEPMARPVNRNAGERLSVTGLHQHLGISKAHASAVLNGKSFLAERKIATLWADRGWKVGVLTHAADADCDAFARVMLREAA